MTAKAYSEHYYESADGLRLYYRDYSCVSNGSTMPLICLPGLTRNCRDFELLAESLARQRRVITPDLRGRGRSEHDSNWRNYHPYQYVADVWALLDGLHIDRVVVVGTSLGGLMTTIMAYQRGTAVAAAVLNDIGPEMNLAGIQRITAYAGNQRTAPDWETAVEQTRQKYELALPGLSNDLWRWYTGNTYSERPDGLLELNVDQNVGLALRAGVSGLRHDPWILFDALYETPTLALRGALSDVLTAATLRKMTARYPNMIAVSVANRGHVPLLNEPEVTDALTRFLDSLENAAG